MGELLDFVRNASDRFGLPPEILTGLPVTEITGDSAVMIEQHRGILAYCDTAVRIGVNLGAITVSGENLTIRVMNREKIILCGRIRTIGMERKP